MATKLVGHALAAVGQDLTAIDGPSTVATANGLGQRNLVGTRCFDDAGNEFIYLPGVASLAAGDWVTIMQSSTFATTRLLNDANTGASGAIAVAMAAAVASCWGWFQIYGFNSTANVATVGAPTGAAALYRTGTTARVGTSAVAKDAVFGAFLVGASVSNVGPVFLNYPFNMDQSTL